jgi:hypothetical protein
MFGTWVENLEIRLIAWLTAIRYKMIDGRDQLNIETTHNDNSFHHRRHYSASAKKFRAH